MNYIVEQSSYFKSKIKKYYQKYPEQSKKLIDSLRLLAENPFDPSLRTHKLKGELDGSWACSASYNLRIIFKFISSKDDKHNERASIILLQSLGPHEDVY
jgi:mRNA-degrading endonuclease YafQ of YafQ-DinJ toxin-antitoxin module